MMGGYVFSLSTIWGGGRGYPHNTPTGLMSFLGGTPVTGPRSGWGRLHHDEGYSPIQGWVPSARSGQRIPPGRDWLHPPPSPRIGYTWTGYAADGTPLAVSCLRAPSVNTVFCCVISYFFVSFSICGRYICFEPKACSVHIIGRISVLDNIFLRFQ